MAEAVTLNDPNIIAQTDAANIVGTRDEVISTINSIFDALEKQAGDRNTGVVGILGFVIIPNEDYIKSCDKPTFT